MCCCMLHAVVVDCGGAWCDVIVTTHRDESGAWCDVIVTIHRDESGAWSAVDYDVIVVHRGVMCAVILCVSDHRRQHRKQEQNGCGGSSQRLHEQD